MNCQHCNIAILRTVVAEFETHANGTTHAPLPLPLCQSCFDRVCAYMALLRTTAQSLIANGCHADFAWRAAESQIGTYQRATRCE